MDREEPCDCDQAIELAKLVADMWVFIENGPYPENWLMRDRNEWQDGKDALKLRVAEHVDLENL